MKFLNVSLTLLLALSSTTFAQEISTPHNDLRVGVSLNSSTLVLSDGTDTLSTSETNMVWGTTFQSHQGFLGELAFSKANIYQATYNSDIADVDESYSSTLLGFGYRLPVNTPGKYWGVGYQHVSVEDSTSNTLRTFWEKDNSQRYGVINLSLSSDESSSMLGVSGQHIWFLNQTTGIGLNWAVGSGSIDNTDIGIGSANFGAALMFRPKF